MVFRQQDSKILSRKFPRNSAHENFQYNNILLRKQVVFLLSIEHSPIQAQSVLCALGFYYASKQYASISQLNAKPISRVLFYTLYRGFRATSRGSTSSTENNHNQYIYAPSIYLRHIIHIITIIPSTELLNDTKVHKHPYTSITISIIYYIFIYYI